MAVRYTTRFGPPPTITTTTTTQAFLGPAALLQVKTSFELSAYRGRKSFPSCSGLGRQPRSRDGDPPGDALPLQEEPPAAEVQPAAGQGDGVLIVRPTHI